MDIDFSRKINEQRQNFISIENKPYTGDEYYEVFIATDQYYDDYQEYLISTLGVEIMEYVKVEEPVIFGFTREVEKKKSKFKQVGVYAIKTQNGIYEMITGKKLGVYGEQADLYCYGIKPVRKEDLYLIGNDLSFINRNSCKDDYSTRLKRFSDEVYNRSKIIYEQKLKENREKQEGFEYLKNYKIKH